MGLLLQLLVNGLITGAVYALVASGFSLTYSVCKFMNFAHGAFIASSGYLFFFFYSRVGVHLWLSAALAISLASASGYLLDRVYSQMRRRGASSVVLLIGSFAALIIFNSMILMMFGADLKTVDAMRAGKGIGIFNIIITPLQASIIGTSLAIFILLSFFLKKTRMGLAMRAVSDNKQMAEILGISSERIYALTFMLAAAIAGIGGILISLEQGIDPNMGNELVVKGFAASVVGGIGSVPGAVIGSFVLGLTENLGVFLFPSQYKDLISFWLLIMFLIFRPRGIMGVGRDD